MLEILEKVINIAPNFTKILFSYSGANREDIIVIISIKSYEYRIWHY